MFEKTQQKLSGELKNTPASTSLACSSVSSGLNREETLSVQDKVLTDNNLEENQQSGRTGQDLRVPVLNMRGKPLIRRRRYKLQPKDLVRYDSNVQRVKGVFSYGKWVRLEDGTNTNIKNVGLVTYGKGIQFN